METTERLDQAIQAREIISIVYHGGSKPGSIRSIGPINIKNGKVRAKCYSSNIVKTFLVEKMQIIDGDGVLSEPQVRSEIPMPSFTSLREAYDSMLPTFNNLGWHVEINENQLSLHRKFKNGKPRKSSDVWIDYQEYTFDCVMGFDGEFHEENYRKRARPWTVRAIDKETATYGRLGLAIKKLVQYSELLSPRDKV